MRVTVLGNRSPYALAGEACSGYLVEIEDAALLIDCGPGVFANLASLMPPAFMRRRLKAVVITHLHHDHALDLFQLGFALLTSAGEDPEPMPLYVPGDGLNRLAAASVEMFGSDVQFHGIFQCRSLAAGPVDGLKFPQSDGPATELVNVTAHRTDHPVETYALRLERDGRILTYSADSSPCESLVEAARGADVFIAEAGARDVASARRFGHMTPAQAGSIAARAGAKRLYLTHLPPGPIERETLIASSGFPNAHIAEGTIVL